MNRIYERLASLPYMTAYKRLVEGAITLGVFSQLEAPMSAQALADTMGWHKENTHSIF